MRIGTVVRIGSVVRVVAVQVVPAVVTVQTVTTIVRVATVQIAAIPIVCGARWTVGQSNQNNSEDRTSNHNVLQKSKALILSIAGEFALSTILSKRRQLGGGLRHPTPRVQ